MTPNNRTLGNQETRARIEALLAAGQAPMALAECQRLWPASRDAAAARFLKQRREALWAPRTLREHRVAIVRSFTVEPLVPLLEAEAALAGCRLEPWVGAFNGYAQEILDVASPLYAHRPDTIILALQARDVAPALWSGFTDLSPDAVSEEIDRVANLLIDLLRTLRASSTANILCHGLERPLDPCAGFLDLHRDVRQADALEAVNRKLRGWCATQAGVCLLDYEGVIGRFGREAWFDEKKFASTRLPLSARAIGWLAAEWWRHLACFALPRAKVLALDLDNTLWGGVVGEDGPHGIRLGLEPPGGFYREFQKAILDISRRGVLLVLASKNNEADALDVIDEHPEMLIRRQHLAGWRINWDPKSASLESLAKELNLGLDSFIFVDDNPAECEAMRHALPEVEVIELPRDPSHYARIVRQNPRFERLSVSREDADRNRYYADERGRRELQAGAASLEAFLESLDIEVSVEPVSSTTLARAAQLTQKTNQLNMTTRRYTEAELEHRLHDPSWSACLLRSRDRFGDHGIVGLAMTRSADGISEIDTFLLSCRVIGRGIEFAFLSQLANAAEARGERRLEGRFVPTAKNAPAAQIYERAGFALERSETAAQTWGLTLEQGAIGTPAWIRWTESLS